MAIYGAKPLIVYDSFPYGCLIITIFIRAFDLLWVRSSFVPDEYWQSLEVAHKSAFGYGNLTWEWIHHVRNYIYPSIFTLIYKILAYFEYDTQELVVFTPRIFQVLVSALGDVYFLRWVAERRNGQYGWAFLSWITCTFISFCSTRTLINVFEMNLTTVALYYYPWSPKKSSFLFVLIVTLVSYMRPTGAATWLPLVAVNIISNRSPIKYFATNYVPVMFLAIAACIGFDSYMYNTITITPLNFFKYNVIDNISSFYGSHDFAWYLYLGIPVVLGGQTIPFLISAYNVSKRLKYYLYDIEVQLLITILWNVILFSVCPHKEFRFLLPIVPMMVYLSSSVLSRWSAKAKIRYVYLVGTLLVVVHTAVLIFLGQFHQMGSLEAVQKLGAMARNNTKADILYLAPCHTFPGYSHLHVNVSARHLNCQPNLNHIENYVDEADRFYSAPVDWLKREFASSRPCSLPTHIVKFDTLNITNYLYANNFTLIATLFHTYYPLEPRIGENVQIYQRKGTKC